MRDLPCFCRRARRFLLLPFATTLAWLCAPAAAPAQEPVSTASIVRFNTLCATCHEGECSGRLSFRLDPGATDNHIRRYTGDISPEAARDLQNLLVRMKLDCGYHAISIPPPADGRWRAELLAQLHAVQENAYFVPLGPLAPGRQRFTLIFDQDATVSIQLISASFEITELPSVKAIAGRATVALEAQCAGEHYLRLRTEQPARLLALEREPHL